MTAPIVLLTSCIDPGQMPNVARRDVPTRLRDYASAIDHWSSSGLSSSFVFCDNSGHPLESLADIARSRGVEKDWEFLSFAGNGATPRGKGLGEIEIIRHALGQSRRITRDSLVIKVTGRLRLGNAAAFCSRLAVAGSHADVYCDLRANLSWADSRLFVARVSFIEQYLLPLARFLDDSSGITFERILARATHAAMANGAVWSMLPMAPLLVGHSGTLDIRYRDGRADQWRRELFRRVKTWAVGRHA